MDTAVFFVEFNGNAPCLICERKKRATQLQRELTSQQSLFHKAKNDADAADKASYVVSEMITKTGFSQRQMKLRRDLQYYSQITILLH
ncbi:hypothetical protein QQF64_004264 [Cirrhinus molitorella]|uniref:Uncharacterized protein n=1 Tax=Cirrhinus molitorella TaxID=172907 RepID=A0ABR3MIR6_9TELE